MDLIKNIGTMQMMDSIYDVEMIPTGVEGDVGPLLFGGTMSSHVMRVPPGLYPAHSHDRELMIMCLKGEVDMFQGEGRGALRGRMKPMSLLYVPKDEEIGMEVPEGLDCEIIVFVAPKRMNRDEFCQSLKDLAGNDH